MDARERQRIEDNYLRALDNWVRPRPVQRLFMGLISLVIFLVIVTGFILLGIAFYNDNVTDAEERRESEAEFCESWRVAAGDSPAPDPGFCD